MTILNGPPFAGGVGHGLTYLRCRFTEAQVHCKQHVCVIEKEKLYIYCLLTLAMYFTSYLPEATLLDITR